MFVVCREPTNCFLTVLLLVLFFSSRRQVNVFVPVFLQKMTSQQILLHRNCIVDKKTWESLKKIPGSSSFTVDHTSPAMQFSFAHQEEQQQQPLLLPTQHYFSYQTIFHSSSSPSSSSSTTKKSLVPLSAVASASTSSAAVMTTMGDGKGSKRNLKNNSLGAATRSLLRIHNDFVMSTATGEEMGSAVDAPFFEECSRCVLCAIPVVKKSASKNASTAAAAANRRHDDHHNNANDYGDEADGDIISASSSAACVAGTRRPRSAVAADTIFASSSSSSSYNTTPNNSSGDLNTVVVVDSRNRDDGSPSSSSLIAGEEELLATMLSQQQQQQHHHGRMMMMEAWEIATTASVGVRGGKKCRAPQSHLHHHYMALVGFVIGGTMLAPASITASPAATVVRTVSCAVHCVWVNSQLRRHGVASHLVDALRQTVSYGFCFPRDRCVFGEPTEKGLMFARRYVTMMDSSPDNNNNSTKQQQEENVVDDDDANSVAVVVGPLRRGDPVFYYSR